METPHWMKSSNKSDRLNADDLACGSVVAEIVGVLVTSDRESPVTIKLADGHRDYKPCLTIRRVLGNDEVFGPDISKWKGRKIRLVLDKEVSINKEKVGGVRVTEVSGIDKEVWVHITVGRGRRGKYLVRPLKDNPGQDLSAEVASLFSQAQTASQLEAARARGAGLPPDEKRKIARAHDEAVSRIDNGETCLKDGDTGYGLVTQQWCDSGCPIGCKKQ